MEKVLGMLVEERTNEINLRGNHSGKPIVAGMRTEPIIDKGERLGYKVVDIITGEEGVMAHKDFDSRLRVLGYGLDLEALERVAIPAIEYAKTESEVLVIDEIGKFTVESEAFVNCVRGALEIDKPTLLTLHKK